MVVVDAKDSAARGFAGVTVEVDTQAAGMHARPFPWDDLLVVLNGPPGAPLAVCIWDCGSDSAALPEIEQLARTKFVPSWDNSFEPTGRTRVLVSGEERSAVTFITGDGPERIGWVAATLERPGGVVLVAAGVAAGKQATVTVDEILANRAVGTAMRTLAIR
jgi:hypothetical protein